MKKTGTLLAIIMLAGCVATQAQGLHKNVKSRRASGYLRAGLGYGFTHAGQTSILGVATLNGSTGYDMFGNGNTTIKKFSFGTGLSVNLAAGYMFNRYFGMELGMQAIVAPTTYKYSESGGGVQLLSVESKAKNPVYLIPALVANTGGRLRLYGRAGLVLPVSDKVKISGDQLNFSGGSDHNELLLTNRFGLGFQGALGLSIPVARHLRIWIEASGISRNAYAKKLEMTAYTVNGTNQLSTLSTHDRITEYSYSVAQTSGPGNPNAANQELTSAIPYSSIGGAAGIRFAF